MGMVRLRLIIKPIRTSFIQYIRFQSGDQRCGSMISLGCFQLWLVFVTNRRRKVEGSDADSQLYDRPVLRTS